MIESIKQHAVLNQDGNHKFWEIQSTVEIKFNFKPTIDRWNDDLFVFFEHSKYSEISEIEVYRNDVSDGDLLKLNRNETGTGSEIQIHWLDIENVQQGDLIRFEIKRITKPDMENIQYFFSQYRYYPIKYSRLIVEVPQTLKSQFHFILQEHSISPVHNIENEQEVYIWEFNDVKPYHYEPNSRGYSNTRKATIFAISETSWETAYSIDNYNKQLYECISDTSGLGDFLSDLNISGLSRKSIVEALYRSVQEKFQYAYIDLHKNGYIPHRISQIIFQAKADCKDYSALLIASLRALGFKAEMVDMQTNNQTKKFYPDLKFIYQFNHAFVRVMIDKKYYFLDATGTIFNLNDIRSDVQGMSAIVFNDLENQVELIQIPLSTDRENQINYKVDASLDTVGNLNGTINYQMIGTASQEIRVQQLNTDQQLKEYFINYFKMINKNIILNSVIATKFTPFIDTVEYKLSFTYPGFSEDLVGDLGIRLLFLNNFDYSGFFDENRQYDYNFFEPPQQINQSYQIHLPNNKIKYLPKNRYSKNQFFLFDFNLSQSNQTINYDFSFSRLKMTVPVKNSQLLNTFFNDLKSLSNEFAVFN